MARPLRIEFPGAWYHVMNRGLGKKSIFLSDDNRQFFLDLLGETSQIFRIEVHAYSLMGNHYHLLIHTPYGGLGRAMRHLNGIYTQRFNRRQRTDGPLFRGRYKALLVESENYLTELVRYIHLNPVKAGLYEHPKDHPWTSHTAYLQPRKRPPWFVTQEILSRFGSLESVASKEMDKFVLEGVPEEFEENMKKQGVILGSRGFQEWVYENILGRKRRMKEIPLKDQNLKPRVKPDQILDQIAHAYGLKVMDLRKSARGQENQARGMATYLLRQLAGLPQRDVADWIKCPSEYTVATIQKRFRAKMDQEKKLKKFARELGRSIMNHVKT